MCKVKATQRNGERLTTSVIFRLTPTEKRLLGQLAGQGKENEAARQIVRQHLQFLQAATQKAS